jgi:hypothetical protein
MKPRLIIIGDSFAKGVNDGSFYADILKERFQWIEVIHDGASSRDAQTIIDHWIKVIPEIRPDDYLVIIIPMLERSRLPLVEKHQTPVAIGKTILVNRFVGTASYNNEEIEIFGDSFGVDYYKNLLTPQVVINSSKASQTNLFEVVASLIKITPCKKYIFSWEDIDRTDTPFDDKKRLIGKMGGWITLNSEFVNTKGKRGIKGDLHWALETHVLFSEFIAVEFGLAKRKNT